MSLEKSTYDGQAIYSKSVLKIYDLWVLGFSNSYLWKCNTNYLREQFVKYATTNHLDIGVGTGFFLDKCLSKAKRRVVLFDLNQNSLDATYERVKRFKPEKYQVDVLETIDVDCEKVDSISINFLLHCLPGSIKEKSILFENASNYLNKNGVLFGSTILGKDVHKNYFANKLMNLYNKKGIFSNENDSLEELEAELNKYFKKVSIKMIGCVAVFSAKEKR